MPIKYFNRYSGQEEEEKVYGDSYLRFIYETTPGKIALRAAVRKAWFSQWYGRKMDGLDSAKRIPQFIQDYGIDVSEMADDPASFKTFNQFFYRKLKPEARPVCKDADAVVFPADGRHLGFADVSRIDSVFVKGQSFDIPALLGSSELAERFEGGALVLSRLCPVDYHRFHFPVEGHVGPTQQINGYLYSVNPIALARRLSIFWENKREITLLQNERVGQVAIIEIGATCVGSIEQTFKPDSDVRKGEEKGYFMFGGSSVITLFQKGRVALADDLLTNSSASRELYAKMGDFMARAT